MARSATPTSSTVSMPAGTAPSSIRQAEQTRATARQMLASAQSTLAADRQTLAQAQAQLRADRLKEQSDCAGANAAQSSASGGAGNGGSGNGGGSASPCAAAAQAVASDETGLLNASQKVTADQGQVALAQTSVNGAEQSLTARSPRRSSMTRDPSTRCCPRSGRSIRRGQPPVRDRRSAGVLLYGPVPAWRAFRPGMSAGRGRGRAEREPARARLRRGLGGDAFTAATARAISALQSAHGMPQTGELPLGSVVFEPGAVRVTSVTPTLGAPVQAGARCSAVTSTRHQVAIALDAVAAVRGQGRRHGRRSRCPTTRPRRASSPPSARSRRSPSSDQGGGGSSYADDRGRRAAPTDPAAAGSLDQAPVDVSITDRQRQQRARRCRSTRCSRSRAAATRSRSVDRRGVAPSGRGHARALRRRRRARAGERCRPALPASAWWCRRR